MGWRDPRDKGPSRLSAPPPQPRRLRDPRSSGLGNQICLRSPDVDPYRIAPSGAATPDRYLVPAFGIGPEPGMMVTGIPVSPILPCFVSVGISFVRPDPLILVISYDGVRLLAVPQSCGAVSPPSTIVDPLLKTAVVSLVSLSPAIIALKSFSTPRRQGRSRSTRRQ
jgi:hypothetical protein